MLFSSSFSMYTSYRSLPFTVNMSPEAGTLLPMFPNLGSFQTSLSVASPRSSSFRAGRKETDGRGRGESGPSLGRCRREPTSDPRFNVRPPSKFDLSFAPFFVLIASPWPPGGETPSMRLGVSSDFLIPSPSDVSITWGPGGRPGACPGSHSGHERGQREREKGCRNSLESVDSSARWKQDEA